MRGSVVALCALCLSSQAADRTGTKPTAATSLSSANSLILSAPRYKIVQEQHYLGMCDASGAVAVTSNLFAVASDEDNVLRLYSTGKPAHPVKEFDCNAFLQVRGKSLEADLEAAARLGDRIFWIGSHGRNRNGKERQNRDRFFATDIRGIGPEIDLVPVGQPYELLFDDMIEDRRYRRFRLGEAEHFAPKEWAAFNIEGLSATPEGHLLIGFRNPIPDGKALLVPLMNPNAVIQGQRAKLGDPIQLDLDGLGIRDIAYHAGTYVIIAGSYDGKRDFRIYRWLGGAATPERVKIKHINDFHPEAMVIYPAGGISRFQVLSDDGTLEADGIRCKDKPPASQGFRSFWLGD
jgi:hypothetical protein